MTQQHDAGSPVAIVGAACRLPGGIDGLDRLWSVLNSGDDVVTEVPPDRFHRAEFVDPDRRRPGKSYTAAGGFLSDVAGFDAEFFGISPREATRMDPQQRLLLELAVEALDDAAIAPERLAGSDTAVFVGVSGHDYSDLQQKDARSVNAYTLSGSLQTNTANRISYILDWHGSSAAVDTACSSALFALHQACEHLRAGRSRVALAGAANILLGPGSFCAFSAASILSPSGRCRAFSADADGFVRAEGGGTVLLKRLDDALADGDRVHAVILGSGTNNDGRTAGLALPSSDAQEMLLRQVYDHAGIAADRLGYLEAHGTGTAVGDPIECAAIGRALGVHRTNGALPIGSVKSNIGHLESAAGAAGLLKALLVLRHKWIPRTLHAEPLNPRIDFERWRLRPAVQAGPLDGPADPVVGVNSFGFGGANAHVVLAAAPERTPQEISGSAGVVPIVVSGRSAAALAAAAERMAERLEDSEDFYDAAHTACRRRGLHDRRIAVLAANARDAASALRAAAHDEHIPDDTAVADAVPSGKVAFAFSGNGSQWAGMGADLLDREPAFRAAVERIDAAMAEPLGWSVLKRLASPVDEIRLEATEIAQPMLLAVQIGLVALLADRGVRPAAVVGHSGGEVPAAYAAGILTLDDAARVVAARCLAQASTAGLGRMAAVGLPPDEAERHLVRYRGSLELAAVNSARDVTVSGDPRALAALGRELETDGVFFRVLPLDYAFHSRVMDPVEAPLREALASLRPRSGKIPFASTVAGGWLPGAELTAGYWWRNTRQPVLFAPAVEAVLAEGCDVFLEVGPHPVLTTYLRRLTAGDRPVTVLPTCVRGGDGPESVRHAVATLMACGADLDWDVWFPGHGQVVELPSYPWQRKRYWNGDANWWNRIPHHDFGRVHPLLGVRQPTLEPTWSADLEPAHVPWLGDHRVGETVVLPAAAYLEMTFAAGGEHPVEVAHLDIAQALTVPWDTDAPAVEVQVSWSDEDQVVRVASRSDVDSEWQQHARARVRTLHRPAPRDMDLDLVRSGVSLSVPELYERLRGAGVAHGPAFRVLTGVTAGDGEVLASYATDQPHSAYRAHPVVLDGALQAGAPLVRDANALFLPAAVDSARLWRSIEPSGWIHVRAREIGPLEMCWDITIADESGRVSVELEGCRLRRTTVGAAAAVPLYGTVLRAAPHPRAPVDASVLPSPQKLLDAAASELATLVPDTHEVGARHRITELSAHFTVAALSSLLPDQPVFTTEDLMSAGVLPRHRNLIEVLLLGAVRHGLLRRDPGGRWHVEGEPDPQGVFADVLREFPDHAVPAAVHGRCGVHLSGVLRGAVDPVELLLSDANRHLVERAEAQFPGEGLLPRAAGAVLRAAVRDWPADRPLRVLEVGAGIGSITAALVDVLPADRTRYVVTDTTDELFPRARNRFQAYDYLDYRVLDLGNDPAAQGITPGAFDIVVAGNALHTTSDLAATLGWLGELLAPGGQLLLVASHDTEALAPVFGLVKGFRSPLPSAREWLLLLEDRGFTDVCHAGDQSLILARRAPHEIPVPVLPSWEPADWIICAEDPEGPLATALAADLGTVRMVEPSTDTAEWSAWLAGTRCPRIVLLLGERPGPEEATGEAVRRIALLGAMGAACDGLEASVWLVTRPCGALPGPEAATHPEDAAIWGAARTLANEHTGLSVRRVSLDPGTDAAAAARRLAWDLLAPGEEDEVVLTAGGRFVARLACHAPPTADRHPGGYRLDLVTPGLNPRLAWVESTHTPPGPDEVVVEVRAAGLNYRDVMLASGLLPAGAEAGTGTAQRLGLECAGVITAVGRDVEGFAVGDKVFALAPAALASHVTAKAATVGRMPDGMDFAAAATLPAVLFTVHHSLDRLARLAPGETVLVHGAAGGVGMAALQYARARGATVIATAGTPAKRDLLRLLGVQHVHDSRGLAFADEIRDLTGGVDVVLNSLAGQAMTRSLELLRPGGRFIELGKRDIYANNGMPLRPFGNNIAFFGVDANQLADNPHLTEGLLEEICDRIHTGHYHPLPHQIFPAGEIREALRTLQHSRHLGKVVITFDEPPAVTAPSRPPRLDPEATYLVTGGLSGLGAATARHLAARGARHLVLLSRRGDTGAEASELLAALREAGACPVARAADVTDETALRDVLDTVRAGGRPLRGVVHAAMVIDDDALTELTPARIESVLAPKMRGAVLLDALTEQDPLDFFVCYSSIAATVGNVHQANYAAANLFVEAFTRARRRRGRPGLAVAWGAISEVGYVARNRLGDALAGAGFAAIGPAEATAVLDDLLTGNAEVVAAARIDWDRLRDILPAMTAPVFSGVVTRRDRTSGTHAGRLRQQLSTLDCEEALLLVADALIEAAAAALQTDPERLDRNRRLDQLGMDSLMGMEFVISASEQLGCKIPVMEAINANGINDLARRILPRLGHRAGTPD